MHTRERERKTSANKPLRLKLKSKGDLNTMVEWTDWEVGRREIKNKWVLLNIQNLHFNVCHTSQMTPKKQK